MSPEPAPADVIGAATPAHDLVLIPTFNDWTALGLLIPQLASELVAHGRVASLLIVDDSSTDPVPGDLIRSRLEGFLSVDVLTLARNVGHQRAIAVGLSYVASECDPRVVVIMDGDGEDLPTDVPRLLSQFDIFEGRRVVFAQRTRRSEGAAFSFFYALYRMAHWLLTGLRVQVGNFSALPMASVKKLVVGSDLWNHYAAAVIQSRLPTALVPTTRGHRLAGKTTMNFVALVSHGLSAMSVFADRIGVRILLASIFLMAMLVAGVAIAFIVHITDPFTISSWVPIAIWMLVVLLGQAAMLAVIFIFIIQGGRATSSFIPARDYRLFVASVLRLYGDK